MQQTENKRGSLPRGMSVDDAAAYVGVHRVTLYRLSKNGALTARKIAGKTIYLRDDLDRFLEGLEPAYGDGPPGKTKG
ncbi:helix-turn-helix domain-containing protein [Sphingobium sp.]|uniref:helix-turn-helix domain-containing protein n=1 Tax=Sphingobium sp. TaxID=1912891 RepID=UPI002CA5A80C|nr:helix-turn-helix domain-containing protein [Sphingobium sp.]HUD90587.1 helix-turn-helix domain-containing protein [Sphingobium sp.]